MPMSTPSKLLLSSDPESSLGLLTAGNTFMPLFNNRKLWTIHHQQRHPMLLNLNLIVRCQTRTAHND